MKRPFFIAEVKTLSPFGFQSEKDCDVLFNLANQYGDMISIHTNPRWGGSFDLLSKARGLTNKPLLAKGIHASDYEIKRALKLGADYVLVVVRVPDRSILKYCFIEPISLKQLHTFAGLLPKDQHVVWNSRDLNTGAQKSTTFTQARACWPGWLCQASNITSPADVSPDANAILVGQELQQFTSLL